MLRDYLFSRDYLRLEFEAAAARSRDPTIVNALQRLSASVNELPKALIDAYEETSATITNPQSESYLIYEVGRSWHPSNASEYLERLIARQTGVAEEFAGLFSFSQPAKSSR